MKKTRYILVFIGVIIILILILMSQYPLNTPQNSNAQKTNNGFTQRTPVINPSGTPQSTDNNDANNMFNTQERLRQLKNLFLIKGRVLVKDKTIPIPGAIVRCIKKNDLTAWFKKHEKHVEAGSSLAQIAFSDENGEFSFCVAKGEYLLYAKYSDDSGIEDVKIIKVPDAMTGYIVLELASYGRIEGYVFSNGNLPLAGAKICVHPDSPSKLVKFKIPYKNNNEISTDNNGKFLIDYLEPLNEHQPIKNNIMYCLQVYHPGFYESSSVVAVYENKTSFAEINLTKAPPPVSVKGKITDVNGNPIEDILVEYQLHEPTDFAIAQNEIEKKRYISPGYGGGSPIKALILGGQSRKSDSSGEFLLDLGRPTILSKALLFIKPQKGYAFYTQDIFIETGESIIAIEIKLVEDEHIQGFVLDSSGPPLESVEVSTSIELQPTGTLIDCSMTSTDKNGYFNLSGLTAGQTYNIRFGLKDSIYEDTYVDITAPAFNQMVLMDKKKQ